MQETYSSNEFQKDESAHTSDKSFNQDFDTDEVNNHSWQSCPARGPCVLLDGVISMKYPRDFLILYDTCLRKQAPKPAQGPGQRLQRYHVLPDRHHPPQQNHEAPKTPGRLPGLFFSSAAGKAHKKLKRLISASELSTVLRFYLSILTCLSCRH